MTRSRHAKNTCYMCDQFSTSKEHFPPKCFFPEGYRENLHTVPSCDDHNSDKSKDDEYLLLMFYSHYKNDPKLQSKATKWAERAVRKNPNLRNFFANSRPLSDKLIAFDVDRDRINSEIEHIARAAYYHESNDKWPFEIGVLCTGLLSDPSTDGIQAVRSNIMLGWLGSGTDEFLQNQPRRGSNQKVFYYQFSRSEDQKDLLIRMVFFGGMVAIAFSSPKQPLTLE